MGIKTEEFVPGLPPKEPTAGVDWLGILDAFDPSLLEQKYLDECARRNPYETCYPYDDPPYRPVEERLQHAEFCVGSYRRNLEACVRRIQDGHLSPIAYNNARAALITAIGIKGAAEVVRREYERLGEKGRQEQAEAYAAWEKECEAKQKRREKLQWLVRTDPGFMEDPEEYGLDEEDLEEFDKMVQEEEQEYESAMNETVHEKVIRVRKGWRGSDGKFLTQRDFAKLLDYPVSKYQEAEKTDRYGRGETMLPVEDELLEKLVMIAHANPYWLFDPDCEAYLAENSFDSDAVLYGDQPCIYAKPDVILKWIMEGKPVVTDWTDGIPEKRSRW